GIEEKPLFEIKEGDFLIMPEKINVQGELQEIKTKDYYNSFKINNDGKRLLEEKRTTKQFFQRELADKIEITQTAVSTYELGKRNLSREILERLCYFLDIDSKVFIENCTEFSKPFVLPNVLNEKFAQFLGYFLGDGCMEKNRVTFFEQRKELALAYKKLIDGLFNTKCSYRFRESKNYYQLRVYSLELAKLIKNEFPELAYAVNSKMPVKILKSPDNILASFIKGFFDAEGYVSGGRVALGINNKLLARQLHFCLLRLGIVSSINEYDNRRNPYSKNIRYTLAIDDFKCLNVFENLIGFSSSEKNNKLKILITNRKNRSNIRQLVINGGDIARIIRNSGLNTSYFKCPSFFVNKRQMSKEVFKERILNRIENEDLKKRLEFIYNSNLILVKIHKIQPLKIEKTIDIETKNHNFIANGIIVHNSSARYGRIRDNLARDFYRKVAEAMKDHFFNMTNLKGIIIGGPGPTKEDFLKEGELVTSLKNKVLGVKDIGYSDEHGIDLLVEASGDILAEQEITKERKLLERFFNMLGKDKDKTAYGEEEVEKALSYGAVDTLFLSKKLKKSEISHFEKKAIETGVKIEMISVETEEGVQFYNLSGIGAILRFKIM
ncbi:MAG: LAGLIDADG family homing endonuclease, partial [Nanoarchaeota archaeon]